MKTSLFTLLFMALGQSLFAQTKDMQLWENIYAETNINRNWYLHLNHEGRVTNTISEFNYAYLDGGISRKIGKHFKASFDYVFVEKAVKEGYWSERHQVYAALTYKKKLGKFVCYDRQMFQLQVKDIYSSDFGRVPEYYLRNKITIKYKTNSRFTPYFAEEIYTQLSPNNADKFNSDRERYFGGCFYSLNAINEFEIYYLYEHNFNSPNPPQNYVIGVGFSRSFY